MRVEEAETLALRALAFVASDARVLEGFLRVSGLDAEALRRRAAETEFLAGVLDYLLGHEERLLAFCAATDIAPDLPAQARAVLPGGVRSG